MRKVLSYIDFVNESIKIKSINEGGGAGVDFELETRLKINLNLSGTTPSEIVKEFEPTSETIKFSGYMRGGELNSNLGIYIVNDDNVNHLVKEVLSIKISSIPHYDTSNILTRLNEEQIESLIEKKSDYTLENYLTDYPDEVLVVEFDASIKHSTMIGAGYLSWNLDANDAISGHGDRDIEFENYELYINDVEINVDEYNNDIVPFVLASEEFSIEYNDVINSYDDEEEEDEYDNDYE